MNVEHGQNVTNWVVNTAAISTIISTIIGWLPQIAAFIAMLWYAIQVYESATIQGWLKRRRLQKVAKLKILIADMEDRAKEKAAK